jgi:mannose-6-phosphate isomerase-like protein (cupin superfamily)
MGDYTHKNLEDVEDAAPGLGLSEWQESRFPAPEFGAQRVGFAHHRIKPSTRQGFAHRHERAEEVYVVLSGAGRVKLDDDVGDVRPRDVLRVAPHVFRSWEAGPDGLELLAFGAPEADDADFAPNWWTDDA